MQTSDRILGMLWGLHAGDSLGAPLEFLPALETSTTHQEMTGGGSFNWKKGEATDDTDLMLCVLRAIESPKFFSFDILKKEMLLWYKSNPPDIGTTTIRGLKNLDAGLPLRDCGYVDEKFQGNGSLMRVAPMVMLDEDVIGYYQDESTSSLAEVLITQTKMTHGHELCVASDKILVACLKAILKGANKEEVFQVALRKAEPLSTLIFDRLQEIPKLQWAELKTSGFCVDTLCASLWAFLKHANLESALISVVNRGDDSDSCGAVAGALCGAYYGSKSIPLRWLECLEFKDEIAKTLKAKAANFKA